MWLRTLLHFLFFFEYFFWLLHLYIYYDNLSRSFREKAKRIIAVYFFWLWRFIFLLFMLFPLFLFSFNILTGIFGLHHLFSFLDYHTFIESLIFPHRNGGELGISFFTVLCNDLLFSYVRFNGFEARRIRFFFLDIFFGRFHRLDRFVIIRWCHSFWLIIIIFYFFNIFRFWLRTHIIIFFFSNLIIGWLFNEKWSFFCL